jgi:hypothetical protein
MADVMSRTGVNLARFRKRDGALQAPLRTKTEAQNRVSRC